jgi:hypothetical protein
MTFDDRHDPSAADALRRLTALTPDPNRAARVRARCRTQLEQSRGAAGRTAAIGEFASRVLAPVVVGAFCVFYVAVLVATTLRLEGAF